MGTTAVRLAVDVWSDIACPWCYIGKRRFEAGLAAFTAAADGATRPPVDVQVTYHSFELSPDTPVDFDGSEIDFLSRYKGLPAEQVQQMLEQVTQIAESVGLRYDFDRLQHTRTLLAHQALHFARAHGRQLELVERLFAGYFEQGEHLGRPERLAALAAEVGLDGDQLIDALRAGTYEPTVEADLRAARDHGISAVPCFVLDGRYAVSGAQDPAVFTQALQQVADELRPAAAPLHALGAQDAAACADGSCAVPAPTTNR